MIFDKLYFLIFVISFALSYGLILRQYWRKVNSKMKTF
nr:MAG TPA: Neurotransmitter-gated ion-channel transmembrane region [Caudoviricetes sp.]